MNPALILTRGLPGCGKTTEALRVIGGRPGVVRLNRDALREVMYGRAGVLDHAAETSITTIQHTAARQALKAGQDVVVDDCNLRAKYCREWADLAVSCGAEVSVLDLTWVPVEECIRRDRLRGDAGQRSVGEGVIRGMHARYLASGRLAPVTPSEAKTPLAQPYVAPLGPAPRAWLVDVDGTLAKMDGRSPFDWHRVGEDIPNWPVIELVRALRLRGDKVIVMSGRDSVCREETARWLTKYVIPYDVLLMRVEGDNRKDSVVKLELFDEHVRHAFDVRGVIDDRDQVVALWRSLGIMCAQVAPGNF